MISLLIAGEWLQELSLQSCNCENSTPGHGADRLVITSHRMPLEHLMLFYLSALSYKHLKFYFKAFPCSDSCKSPLSAGELR